MIRTVSNPWNYLTEAPLVFTNDKEAISTIENSGIMSEGSETRESEPVVERAAAVVATTTDFKMPSCPGARSCTEKCAKARQEKPTMRTSELPLPYCEPSWGGPLEEKYAIEILKSGVILETVLLKEKSFYVVGRLPSCDLSLAHPTISRYHAILQYRGVEDEANPKGFYIYDLGSTHGTFWNGNRIKSKIYVRLRGGHMLRFGCSQRKYILQAPPDDQEAESECTLTELKALRDGVLNKWPPTMKQQEEKTNGIDWGMAEDADESTDLQENPYASIVEEELTLDDPKKTLRGWFEREGYDLHYQTEERGISQFLCWVDLPLENIIGRPVRAEATVRGKKKESVIQCALEACRILDKYGLLRQANSEGRRRRKRKNWEEHDYYDSDEDDFLDRTGSIERKREQRMKLAGKLEEKVETYESLSRKYEEVAKRIALLSTVVLSYQKETVAETAEIPAQEEDALDAFMSTLTPNAPSKNDLLKMKLELQSLRKEEDRLVKLLDLTRPANLPPLARSAISSTSKSSDISTSTQLLVGKGFSCSSQEIKKRLTSGSHCGKSTNDRSSGSEQSPDDEENMKEEEPQGADIGDGKVEDMNNLSEEKKSIAKKTQVDGTQSTILMDHESIPEDEGRISTIVDSSLDHVGCSFPQSVQRCIETITPAEKPITKENQASHVITKTRTCPTPKNVGGENSYMENYSTWVPPQDQAGDGRTRLNEKYGY